MTIFKQYDSRWGRKNYNGSSTISAAACGPFSVANLVVEYNPNIDPMKVVKYMQSHGYAIRNNGTAWAGIPAAMKAFGLEDVHNVSNMSDVWKYLSQGYFAVFLFRGGSRGGVCWTTAGHYVAVTGFKTENGKHKCYTKDSGGRNHDGWYCYETQMKGLISQVWVGKPSGVQPGPAPTPWTPYDKIAVDGVMGPKTVKKMQMWLGVNQDGKIGKATTKALQNKVGATADGIWGSGTTKKLQKFLGKNGHKVQVDGQFGRKTIMALQRYLNETVKK